jgi:hypothetical protein
MLQQKTFRVLFLLGIFCCFGLLQEASAQKTPKPPTSPVVRGQILDVDDSPIPGATILVDGTTKGTASDLNGFFELDLSMFTERKVTLVMQYIGTETKKIEVKLKDLPKSYGQIKLKNSVL